MTGIDASNDNIEVAKLHSKEMNLNIKYIHCSPENLNFKHGSCGACFKCKLIYSKLF